MPSGMSTSCQTMVYQAWDRRLLAETVMCSMLCIIWVSDNVIRVVLCCSGSGPNFGFVCAGVMIRSDTDYKMVFVFSDKERIACSTSVMSSSITGTPLVGCHASSLSITLISSVLICTSIPTAGKLHLNFGVGPI